MEKTTLKDIADKAGVSMMTIPNVINGKNSRVSSQTADKINAIIKECGIPFRPEYVLNNIPSYEGGLAAGKKIAFMNEGITAVVTTADICAIGIMEGARLGGLRVPIDLSVIGYDDLSLCRFTTPKLTSISQNVELKAQTAIKLLLEKILAGNNDDPCQITLDVELVERQSVISLF